MINTLNIKCVDALIGFQEISNESVDCIITDPPYEVIGGGHGGENSSS
jgi:DNA modification methylase